MLPPPAKRELVVSVDVGEQRVAVIEDDKVAEVISSGTKPLDRRKTWLQRDGSTTSGPGWKLRLSRSVSRRTASCTWTRSSRKRLEGRRHGRRSKTCSAAARSLLVKAVKDPMKSKGARLTTEISLPGRFVVYVPSGEGTGVRAVCDEERSRLREILKQVGPKQGSVIVRTAAEGEPPPRTSSVTLISSSAASGRRSKSARPKYRRLRWSTRKQNCRCASSVT